jgi:hypothetical protein
MYINLKSITKAYIVCVLMFFTTACSKKDQASNPVPEERSNIAGTVDGLPYNVDGAIPQFTYYATDGDATKALSITKSKRQGCTFHSRHESRNYHT